MGMWSLPSHGEECRGILEFGEVDEHGGYGGAAGSCECEHLSPVLTPSFSGGDWEKARVAQGTPWSALGSLLGSILPLTPSPLLGPVALLGRCGPCPLAHCPGAQGGKGVRGAGPQDPW